MHGIPIWVRDASLDQFCLGPRIQKDNLPFVKMRERKLIGLHAMCEHIERRKTRATTISHGVCVNLSLLNFLEPLFSQVVKLVKQYIWRRFLVISQDGARSTLELADSC